MHGVYSALRSSFIRYWTDSQLCRTYIYMVFPVFKADEFQTAPIFAQFTRCNHVKFRTAPSSSYIYFSGSTPSLIIFLFFTPIPLKGSRTRWDHTGNDTSTGRGTPWLHRVMGAIWRDKRILHDWLESILVTIFKNKGNIHKCGNYRGMKLLSQMMKCFKRILDTLADPGFWKRGFLARPPGTITGREISSGSGEWAPGKLWNLESLKCHFLYFAERLILHGRLQEGGFHRTLGTPPGSATETVG